MSGSQCRCLEFEEGSEPPACTSVSPTCLNEKLPLKRIVDDSGLKARGCSSIAVSPRRKDSARRDSANGEPVWRDFARAGIAERSHAKLNAEVARNVETSAGGWEARIEATGTNSMLDREKVKRSKLTLIRDAFAGACFVSSSLTAELAAAESLSTGSQKVGASEVATAESLYQEGKRLMDLKKYSEACAALQASNRLDTAVGTLLNLGRCFELNGQFASAWSTFSEAVAMARRTGQPERAELAKNQRERLWPLVPKVIITVRQHERTMKVLLDGEELAAGALGLPLAVDPGEHQLEVLAPGKLSESRTFLAVSPGADPDQQAASVEMGPLVDARPRNPPRETSSSVDDGSTPGRQTEAARRQTEATRWSAWKWAGLSTTLVGISGTGVGLALGIQAKSDARKADCDENNYCSDDGIVQREDAQDLLRDATIVGVSFGALTAIGLTVFLLAPESDTVQVTLRLNGFDQAALSLAGQF